MLVVSDVDDVFLPKPTDLLVNLAEARASLEALLGRLGDMFKENHIIGSALGPALQAAFQLMVCEQPTFMCNLLIFCSSLLLEVKLSFFPQVCPLLEPVPSRTEKTRRS